MLLFNHPLSAFLTFCVASLLIKLILKLPARVAMGLLALGAIGLAAILWKVILLWLIWIPLQLVLCWLLVTALSTAAKITDRF